METPTGFLECFIEGGIAKFELIAVGKGSVLKLRRIVEKASN